MSDKLRVGVFGTKRGCAYIKVLRELDEVVITALCDKFPANIEGVLKYCPEDVKVFSNFDDFIDCGLDAVVLCNYFNEHTPFAIKALEHGVAVLSETTASSTMKECVELCRAVERTKTLYVFAENYPHMKGCAELKRVYDTGTLGALTFAEGEYVHPMSVEQSASYAPEKYHWRKFLPHTFYSTHSLAPLMYITGTMPKRVIGKAVFNPEYAIERHRYTADTAGIMLCEMDDGSLFRISGSCHFAPHGNWYRIGCINGGIETVRGDENKVRVIYNDWSKPEGVPNEAVYEAEWQTNAELADKAGHGGGDFWVVYNFVQCLLGRQQPYFDVYRATAMSATAILGWYSILDDSRQLSIPDFTKEEERVKWENDGRDPFPRENKPETLPFNSQSWEIPYPVE